MQNTIAVDFTLPRYLLKFLKIGSAIREERFNLQKDKIL